jgi:predicted  nucleic acid-binding Zn-ribbon protein
MCKRLLPTLAVMGLLVAGGVAVYKCSGARGKVAKQKVLDKIDDWLGKDKVRQQELADELAKANKAVETLFDGRVNEQVRVERLTRELRPVKARFEANDSKHEQMTAKLKELVEKVKEDPAYAVSLGEGTNKTTYGKKNLEDLKTALATQTKLYEAAKTEYNDKQRALAEAERSFTLLKNQETDARQKVALFTARKKALDAKLEALAKQQEAAKLLQEGKAGAAVNFDEIEKKLSELEDQAEVAFRKAEERAANTAADELKASKGGDTIEDVLRAAEEARGQK